MRFIIVDTMDPEMYDIVCNEDGKTEFFDTPEEAGEFGEENLQKGFYHIFPVGD